MSDEGNGELIIPSATIPGLADFGTSDMALPRLRLVQAQSQFSEEVGSIFNDLTGTAKTMVPLVVLGVKRGRVHWPKEYQRDQAPLCASDDGVRAREPHGEDVNGAPTDICDFCIFSQWGEDGKPPPCALNYNFLVMDTEDDLPALVSFARTSAKTGKQLLTMAKAKGFERTFLLSTEQQKGSNGKYFTFTVRMGEPVSPEQQVAYAQAAARFAGSGITSDTGESGGNSAPPAAAGVSDADEDLAF